MRFCSLCHFADIIPPDYHVKHFFLRNIEAFYKSSKKGHKGMDEFQSMDTFLILMMTKEMDETMLLL